MTPITLSLPMIESALARSLMQALWQDALLVGLAPRAVWERPDAVSPRALLAQKGDSRERGDRQWPKGPH